MIEAVVLQSSLRSLHYDSLCRGFEHDYPERRMDFIFNGLKRAGIFPKNLTYTRKGYAGTHYMVRMSIPISPGYIEHEKDRIMLWLCENDKDPKKVFELLQAASINAISNGEISAMSPLINTYFERIRSLKKPGWRIETLGDRKASLNLIKAA